MLEMSLPFGNGHDERYGQELVMSGSDQRQRRRGTLRLDAKITRQEDC